MGKASARRKKRRQEYLARLASKNPSKFQREWAKRLESWSREAHRRVGLLFDESGNPVPPAFTLVEMALEELSGCGEEAVRLERDATVEVMTDSCCQAVAGAVDRRMYRLSNARSNQRRMEAGTHKPPR